MATIEMKFCVKGVRLIVRGERIHNGPSGLQLQSVRVDSTDSELIELIDGETFDSLEHAMRTWADAKERLSRIPSAAAPREGVTHEG